MLWRKLNNFKRNQQKQVRIYCKVECVFPMVIIPIQYRLYFLKRNSEHRDNAPHFIKSIDNSLGSNFNSIFLNSSSLLVLSIIISWMSTTFNGAMEQIFFLALSSSSSLSSLTELRFKMTLAVKKLTLCSIYRRFLEIFNQSWKVTVRGPIRGIVNSFWSSSLSSQSNSELIGALVVLAVLAAIKRSHYTCPNKPIT